MKRHIIAPIEIHTDDRGEFCSSQCDFFNSYYSPPKCMKFDVFMGTYKRCQQCLNAEVSEVDNG